MKKSENQLKFHYSETTWLRAIVASIPYIGSSLDIIFSHGGQTVAQRRVEFIFESLQKEMEQVKEESIKKDFLNTEEWNDLIRLAVERGARVRKEEHLKAIASILKGTVTDEISSTFHAENLIDVISALRDDEAIVLREAYQKFLQEHTGVANYGENIKDKLPEELQNHLTFLLKRLESLGMVNELTGVIYGYGGGTFNLTETGKEVCQYLCHISEK